MSTTTTRTGDAANTWMQTTTGETPNSVSISTNSKGQAQIDVKLYFSTPEEMEKSVAASLSNILDEVKVALAAHHIALAGQEGK